MNIDVVSLRMVRDRTVPYFASRTIRQAEDVYRLWQALHADGMPDREELWVLCLDTRNRPSAAHVVSMGTVDSAFANPREVFKIALMANSKKVILMHNHPSGDLIPSEHDLVFTKAVRMAGDLMQIRLVDHVIIGDDGYKSVNEVAAA